MESSSFEIYLGFITRTKNDIAGTG